MRRLLTTTLVALVATSSVAKQIPAPPKIQPQKPTVIQIKRTAINNYEFAKNLARQSIPLEIEARKALNKEIETLTSPEELALKYNELGNLEQRLDGLEIDLRNALTSLQILDPNSAKSIDYEDEITNLEKTILPADYLVPLNKALILYEETGNIAKARSLHYLLYSLEKASANNIRVDKKSAYQKAATHIERYAQIESKRYDDLYQTKIQKYLNNLIQLNELEQTDKFTLDSIQEERQNIYTRIGNEYIAWGNSELKVDKYHGYAKALINLIQKMNLSKAEQTMFQNQNYDLIRRQNPQEPTKFFEEALNYFEKANNTSGIALSKGKILSQLVKQGRYELTNPDNQ